MQITNSDFAKLMQYIAEKLKNEGSLDVTTLVNGKTTRAVTVGTISGILMSLKLDEYLVDTGTVKEKKKPIVVDSKFQTIWDAYPSSASFSYRGISWKSSRVLRANYQVCEMLYLKAVAVGSVTHDQILGAVRKQIQMVKEESYESGNNGMQYLPSLEVWIRQARYEAMIGTEEEEEYTETNNNCA